MKVINKTRNIILADNCFVAKGPLQRVKGLLGRSSMQRGSALLLKPCNSIHSFFMKFAIDALFVDKSNRVVGILPEFRPFRISPVYFQACCVIEFPAGTLLPESVRVGDRISLE
jgi:uncharacterized membrane protein (UPF0127 family)